MRRPLPRCPLIVLVLVVGFFDHRQTEDDDDHKDDHAGTGPLQTGKRDVENLQHEIGVGMGDAHWRLDAEGITEKPSFANQ
jgi:hypothetical protein